MVVVEREHEADALDRLLVRPAHDDRSVAPLRREHLHAADHGAQHAARQRRVASPMHRGR